MKLHEEQAGIPIKEVSTHSLLQPALYMSSSSGLEPELAVNDTEILSAFCTHYYRFEQAVNEAKSVSADSNVLA